MYIFLVFLGGSYVFLVFIVFFLGFAIEIGNFLLALLGATRSTKCPTSEMVSVENSEVPNPKRDRVNRPEPPQIGGIQDSVGMPSTPNKENKKIQY